jgi:hypothetical protein
MLWVRRMDRTQKGATPAMNAYAIHRRLGGEPEGLDLDPGRDGQHGPLEVDDLPPGAEPPPSAL